MWFDQNMSAIVCKTMADDWQVINCSYYVATPKDVVIVNQHMAHDRWVLFSVSNYVKMLLCMNLQ